MNRFFRKTRSTRAITFLYFFLLLYTLSALLWWGIALYNQSTEIMQLKRENLRLLQPDPVQLREGLARLHHQEHMHKVMYWGEGLTFLLVILLGAVFVYRAMRRQIRFSNQQHNFMLSVTHELKSPIAVTKLNLETLLKRQLDTETHQKLIKNTLRETNRLDHLCNNMLLASQFESRQYHLIREPVDFSRLLRQCLEDNKMRLGSHRVKGEVIPGVHVLGDTLLLQIAVNNLVENAAKYSPAGTEIVIRLSADNDQLCLQVADQGMGIMAEEKKKIFTRFYRIGNENTRKTKGTGLGLFLTKKIVQQHGGEIRVMDNKPQGSIFEVSMPIFNSLS